MTPEERAHVICQQMEAHLRAGGVVTTAHYDAGAGLIAAAIREAVSEEQKACAALVASLIISHYGPGGSEARTALRQALDAVRERMGLPTIEETVREALALTTPARDPGESGAEDPEP